MKTSQQKGKKMKYVRLIAFALLLISTSSVAAQSCICTAGCKIVSDPYPPGTGQPASCTVYKGSAIASAPVVLSSTVPLNNNTVCLPASQTYVPGVAGSVSCMVTIPAQAAGNVTLTMTATNGAGETAQSSLFTFQSVSALPTLPQVPVNLRAN